MNNNNYSKSIGTTGRTAAIVAYDKKRDLALLRVDDRERPLQHVATLYEEGEDDGPWIFQKALGLLVQDLASLRFPHKVCYRDLQKTIMVTTLYWGAPR